MKVSWLMGSNLEPVPPQRSADERVRSLHICEKDQMDDDQLRDWVRQAADLPGNNLF